MSLSANQYTHRQRLKKDAWKEWMASIKQKQLDPSWMCACELISAGQVDRIIQQIISSSVVDLSWRIAPLVSFLHSFYMDYTMKHNTHTSTKELCSCVKDQAVINFLFWYIPIWFRIANEPSDGVGSIHKLPKITDNDMNLSLKKGELLSHNLTNIRTFFKVDDPKLCMIPISEICENIERRDRQIFHQTSFDKVLFWIHWILYYEKQSKTPLVCALRPHTMIDMKFQRDVIWLIWDVVFYYVKDMSVKQQTAIRQLYELYSIPSPLFLYIAPTSVLSRLHLLYQK
jgi:hypothetical protein